MLKFIDLHAAPPTLSAMQKRILWVATAIVAIGRGLAISRSLWDWDEAHFADSLREYDVAQHLPHPPGFPLFVGVAKVIHLFVASEFRSVQIVTVAGAIALFPVMVLLGRELRLPFATNLIAALLLAHMPNVWFFGGTAFSDVPSLTLILLASALLLRGCRDERAYFAGALLLGIAAGVRTQNLLVGTAPAIIATSCRIRATRSLVQPLVAIVIVAVTVGSAYGAAAIATGGWERYQFAVAAHREYIATIDSYGSPGRPALLSLFEDFFIRPFKAGALNVILGALAAIGIGFGLVRRSAAIVVGLAMFLPFALTGWLVLDHHSTSRFSIAWTPMIALAAAHAISSLARLVARGRQRVFRIVEGVAAAWLIVELVLWTIPALNQVRQQPSPPMQAAEWIRTNVPPGARLYVHHSLSPVARLTLTDYHWTSYGEETPVLSSGPGSWLVQEGVSTAEGARTFRYRRNNLWDLARRRYFEVALVPQTSSMHFGEGWYGEELSDAQAWRWMGRRATVKLPAVAGDGRLRLRFYAPLDAVEAPTVTIAFNGHRLDQFVVRAEKFARDYVIASRTGAPNELTIETTEVVNAARRGTGADARDLGLRLDGLTWSPR